MALKDIIYAEVRRYKGDYDAVALRMRVMGFPKMTGDTLQKKVSTTCDTHHLRVDEMEILQEILDTDRFAAELAKQRFMVCIPLVRFSGVSDQELLDLVFKSEEERGQWAAACRDALKDGRIDLRELDLIKTQYFEYLAADAELIARLESMVNPAELERRK